jgi:hypothetical protein
LTEVPGVRMDPWARPTKQPHRYRAAAGRRRRLLAQLPARSSYRRGLLPAALRACLRAWRGAQPYPALSTDGALLLEIYVHDGIGTMVIDEKLEELREATIDDVGGIIQLIEPFERDGTLVKRDRTEIERDIASYTVIEHDGVIFGCAALHPYLEAGPPKWPPSPSRPRARARAMAKSCSNASSNAPAPWAAKHVCADHANHALVHQARLSARGARMAARGRKAKYNWAARARCW